MDEGHLFGSRLRLKTTYETTVGSNQLAWVDEITNLRSTPAEVQLLYHLNVGPPFLGQDARFVAPMLEIAPRDSRAAAGIETFDRYEAPTPGYAEQVFLIDPAADAAGQTLALLRKAGGDKGLSVHYNKRELPCFTLWKNSIPEADGYVTGLEPALNYPNFKTYERQQGRVLSLPPGGTYRCRVELRFHQSADEVAAVEREIAALQGAPPKVHREPRAGFSPGRPAEF
jgi:hypothetical protein